MKHRTAAYLAAAWGILFAAPHIYWATGRKDGLGTALSDRVVRDAGTSMAISCAGIALFCLCGAAVAMATVQDWPAARQAVVRRALIVLTWFGAVLLIARSVDIYVEFNLVLTGLEHIPADQHANFLHLSRWFMLCYGPWFALGAIAWTRLAWRYTRGQVVDHKFARGETETHAPVSFPRRPELDRLRP
jgi:hypothetical protein